MNESELYQVARVVAPPEQLQGNTFILPPNGAPVTLHWDNLDVAKLPRYVHLRIMAARDDNEEKWVEAFWPTTGESLRLYDIQHAQQFQLFAITVERHDAERIVGEGLSLRLDDSDVSLDIFCNSINSSIFAPHIVNKTENAPLDEFYERMASLASLQTFDWTEGAVLNGLVDLMNAGVFDHETIIPLIETHFMLSKELSGRQTIELLPCAILTQVMPDRLENWLEGALWQLEQWPITPQSAYAHAYPIALMSRLLNRPELADKALAILREVSQQKLGSWSRDVGLYLLGLVRTLLELPAVDEDLRAEVERLCAWVVQYQSKPGLWATYVDDLKTPPDTMGTAAIATALALAYTRKLIPTRYTTEVNNAVQVLKQFLTPDGFLTGAAPLYEDEALQRSDYRVISQVGMGFFAQLLATSKIFRA